MNTLAKLVEQFFYTHMPNAPYRRELLDLIVQGEVAYLNRIRELEQSRHNDKPPVTAIEKASSPQSSSLSAAASTDPVVPFDDEYADTRYWGMD